MDVFNMNTRKIQIIINILIIILEIMGFIVIFNNLGFKSLEYYTEDSNFLLLLSSTILLIYLMTDKEVPQWLESFRFIAIVSTTLTLIIVVTVLSWTTNIGLYNLLFGGSMLYHHTLCPILAIISFICIEKYDNLNALIGIIFTIIYGAVMIPLNILGIVKGPYPFLMVNTQPVMQTILWIVIIYTINYGIALILKKSNGKVII